MSGGPAVSRRGFLTAAGGAVVGAAVGGTAVAVAQDEPAAGTGSGLIAFDGAHQAGITTPAQDRLHVAAFDLVPGASRAELRDLMAEWTTAARRMTAGRGAGAPAPSSASPPTDTGEADDLAASRLTITFGFGPGLFAEDRLRLYAGCGLVSGSDPELELAESQAKLVAMRDALETP